MQTILAIDDELSVRQSYRMILSDHYHVLLAENGQTALRMLEDSHADLILLDLMMPKMNGIEMLTELRQRGETTPVIVVTATNSVSAAVEAMKLGAFEYIIKPFEIEEIMLVAERAMAVEKDQRELQALRESETKSFEAIVGDSPALNATLSLARRAMDVDSTVLITGESGTGKDLIARAIHSCGRRSGEPFVPVSCCAIPTQLIESDLFGHEKGAFTGATEKRVGKLQVADGGTLFLDEIGEMPLEAQAKLLRVLQDGRFHPVGSHKVIEVDTRIVCATNRNLRDAINEGIFREDLYFRINVLPIEMPSLRKRREDIPKLIDHFIAKHAARSNAKTRRFSTEAVAQFTSYPWPGNVRELENAVERVLVYHGNREVIDSDCIFTLLPTHEPEAPRGLEEFEGLPLDEATRFLERHLIERALDRSGQVQSQAADLLGTTRRILKYKMDQLNLSPEAGKDEEIMIDAAQKAS